MSELVNTKLSVDLQILQDITAPTWGKEDELKGLKSELAVLDRKITAELAPKHDEKDDVSNESISGVNRTLIDEPTTKSVEVNKDSLVAEPFSRYVRHKPYNNISI